MLAQLAQPFGFIVGLNPASFGKGAALLYCTGKSGF